MGPVGATAVSSSTNEGHIRFLSLSSTSYYYRDLCPEKAKGELGSAATLTTAPAFVKERRREEH